MIVVIAMLIDTILYIPLVFEDERTTLDVMDKGDIERCFIRIIKDFKGLLSRRITKCLV